MRTQKQKPQITYRRDKYGVEITGNSEDVRPLIEKDLNRAHVRWCLRVVLLLLGLLLRCQA